MGTSKKIFTLLIAFWVAVFFSMLIRSGVVRAVPILNVANGHYYDKVTVPERIDWDTANLEAESLTHLGMQGHLLTLTDQSENDWFLSNFDSILGHFLGAFQPDGSPEPDGNWQWVTGEAWSLTNWNAGEPNNQLPQIEERIHFVNSAGKWNDITQTATLRGYIIEYESETVQAVPEPTTIALLGIGLGLVGLAGIGSRRRLRKTKQ